jgi:hypothetical protein
MSMCRRPDRRGDDRVLVGSDGTVLGVFVPRRAALASMYMEWHSMYMSIRHKHLKIDQSKLDRAKRILRLPTEQETIDRALDAILAEETILRAHRKARAVGGFVDPFGRVK